MRNIYDCSYEDFLKVPYRGTWTTDVGQFDSLIILPIRVNKDQIVWYRIKRFFAKLFKFSPPALWKVDGMHDSGYQMMDFIAVKNGTPIARLSGCSDVLHIEGIGGRGDWSPKTGFPTSIHIAGWSIDCLPNSGLLRLFPGSNMQIIVGHALSSFSIYSREKEPE